MDSNLTIDEWLRQSTRLLTDSGVDTARLDCLVLIGDALDEDRSWILAHPDHLLSPDDECELNAAVQRRARHIPLAYIRGKAEFYGREYMVTSDVLVPRPESETIIDTLQAFVASHDSTALTIIDVGTGSGALAVTAKLEFPDAHVIGIDIDNDCLDIARRNADRHRASVTLLHGNLLDPIHGPAMAPDTILLCNLPYVPDDYPINQAASHEPKLALFAGTDGLDYYRTLFAKIALLAHRPIAIITESLSEQHAALRTIAMEHGYTESRREGLVQLFVPRGS